MSKPKLLTPEQAQWLKNRILEDWAWGAYEDVEKAVDEVTAKLPSKLPAEEPECGSCPKLIVSQDDLPLGMEKWPGRFPFCIDPDSEPGYCAQGRWEEK